VLSVAFASADRNRLVSGSRDGTILGRFHPMAAVWLGDRDGHVRVWDLSQPHAAPLVLSGHEGPVNSVAFAPDGQLFSAGDD
jgi:WD40 repeat protein